MRKQVLLLTIIVIIAMKLFTPEDKLKNYDTFQSMAYTPITEVESDDSFLKLPPIGAVSSPTDNGALGYIQNGIKVNPSQNASVEAKTNQEDYEPNDLTSLAKFSDSYKWFKRPELPSNILDGEKVDTPVELKADGIRVNVPADKLFNLTKKAIGKVETDNNFRYMRWDTGKGGKKGSGAWGKYQFIGRDHEAMIKKVTGLSLQDFLKSEQAQDKYFAYHYQKNLMPLFIKARKSGLVNHLSDVEILGGLHFRMNDFLKMYKNGTASAKADNNPTLVGHVNKIRKAAYGA